MKRENRQFKIYYDWKPRSTQLIGAQHDGALCVNVEWSKSGTCETWEIGEFDSSIYPVIYVLPWIDPDHL